MFEESESANSDYGPTGSSVNVQASRLRWHYACPQQQAGESFSLPPALVLWHGRHARGLNVTPLTVE